MDVPIQGSQAEYFEPIFSTPMTGYGAGLPQSRLYAKYFGGDMGIQSVHGYGANVYVYLPNLESNGDPLPM